MYNNQNQNLSPKAMFKNLSIIHGALIAGQVMFAIVASTIAKNKHFDLNLSADSLLMVAPILAVGCFIMSSFLFKQQLQIAANKSDLKSKITGYQTASIVRMAPLEGASLFNIVVFLLSGNYFTLIISILIVLYFLSFRPTKDRVTDSLNLSYEEQSEL